MNKRIVTANIKSAYGWKFKNVPKFYRDEFERTGERLNQLESDINIGFEKDQREIILKHLEGLARKNVVIDLRIPLSKIPEGSPHHLDNENEIIKFDKVNYSELIISRIEKGRKVEIANGTIKLNLDYGAITNLFTRLYVNMEIYATFEDNIVLLEDEMNSKIRLIIWGVMNGKPIYY
jgi:hypothetical protein